MFLKKRNTNAQEKYFLKFNIPNNQGNENQNYIDISSHSSQNGKKHK